MSEAKGFRDDPAKVLSGKNGEFDGHSYNYLVRTIYLHSIMPDQREEASFFFINSLHKCLFSTYYEPKTLLGTGDITLNKRDKNRCHH